MKTQLPTLYSRSSTGALRQWTMFIEGPRYWAEYGQVGGSIITDTPTEAIGKNIGRSNETTPEQQAVLEAKSRWQSQVDSGYVTDSNRVDDPPPFFKVMKADDFHKQKKPIKYPVIVQPKLDGTRNTANAQGNTSREGKKYVACPHVTAELAETFKVLDGLRLDGEFYNHELKDDFNEIVSIVKKQDPTSEELETASNIIQYWVYDCPEYPGMSLTDSYTKRMDALKSCKEFQEALSRGIINLIPSFVANSAEEVHALFELFVEEGYEGAMIRAMNSPYECDKRSKHLLKYKQFMDAEFTITDIEQGRGKRSGMAGKVHFVTDDGKPFKSNIRGGFKFYKDLLANKNKYIGQKATVVFANYTPDGIPRFPYTKAIRDYE